MRKYLFERITKITLGVLVVSIWLTSCNESLDQQVEPDIVQAEAVAYRNGKISFASGQDFSDFVNKEFKKSFADYQLDLASIVPTEARARKNIEGDVEDEFVDDPYFASLLNEEREVVIGKLTFRITKYGTFAFREQKRKKALKIISKIEDNKGKLTGLKGGRMSSELNQISYDQFMMVDDGSSGGGIQWYPVTDADVSIPPLDLQPVADSRFTVPFGPYRGLCGVTSNTKSKIWWGSQSGMDFGTGVNHVKDWNALRSGRDLKAVVWSENWGIFSSTGIKSVNQRKGVFGIWFRDQASTIKWTVIKGKLVIKDMMGNPVEISLANLKNGEELPNASIVSETWDFNTAKFKIVLGGQDKELDEGSLKAAGLSKEYKIKDLHSCHYVEDEGHRAEIQLFI